ncbi:MAG TPA: large conductance mechanosensitive channel protein MscL [Jiangellaceae bacterium]
MEEAPVLKGFKDFVLRGNVIDLAVAVVIGTAFTAIVTSISDNLISPIIAALGGGEVTGLTTQLRAGNEASIINWAAVITAAINFVIVAAIVYFLFVAPMNRLREMRERGETEEPEAPSEDVLLLREIRDLLANDRQRS